jgi:hypothetical protein
VFTEEVNLLGVKAVFGVVMTQLSLFTIPPAKNSTVLAETERVLPATGNLDDCLFVNYASDHRRYMDVIRASMPKLAENSPSPRVNLAFIADCSCVVVAAIN